MFPSKDEVKILFAHVAYRFGDRFALRQTGISSVEVRNREDLDRAIPNADVKPGCASGLKSLAGVLRSAHERKAAPAYSRGCRSKGLGVRG